MAVRQPRSAEDRQPVFVARAPDSTKRGRWVTVGYAWPRGSGEGYSIKLNSIPVGSWDGALVLVPPFQQQEDDKSGVEQSHDPETGDFR